MSVAVVTRIAQEVFASLNLSDFVGPNGIKLNVADIEAKLMALIGNEENAKEIAAFVSDYIVKDCCLPLFKKCSKKRAATDTSAPSAKKAKKAKK